MAISKTTGTRPGDAARRGVGIVSLPWGSVAGQRISNSTIQIWNPPKSGLDPAPAVVWLKTAVKLFSNQSTPPRPGPKPWHSAPAPDANGALTIQPGEVCTLTAADAKGLVYAAAPHASYVYIKEA